MAEIIVSGIDSNSGQPRRVGSNDIIVDASGNLILAGGVELLSETQGIDATSTGTTALYTVPSGIQIIITKAIVRVTNANTVTGVPTLGVGIAAGEDDIVFPQALTGLSATGDVFALDVEAKSVIANAGDAISLGIDSAATATTLTLAVDLIGYVVGATGLAPKTRVISSLVLSSNQSTGTGFDKIDIDSAVYDPYGIFDAANNQFTIPDALDGRRIDVRGKVIWLSTPSWSTSDVISIQIMHKDSTGTAGNSSSGDPGLLNLARWQSAPIGGTNNQYAQTWLRNVQVAATDFIELYGASSIFASGRAFWVAQQEQVYVASLS